MMLATTLAKRASVLQFPIAEANVAARPLNSASSSKFLADVRTAAGVA
jgi:hypothetical protein